MGIFKRDTMSRDYRRFWSSIEVIVEAGGDLFKRNCSQQTYQSLFFYIFQIWYFLTAPNYFFCKYKIFPNLSAAPCTSNDVLFRRRIRLMRSRSLCRSRIIFLAGARTTARAESICKKIRILNSTSQCCGSEIFFGSGSDFSQSFGFGSDIPQSFGSGSDFPPSFGSGSDFFLSFWSGSDLNLALFLYANYF
jgi:hypothetical protein